MKNIYKYILTAAMASMLSVSNAQTVTGIYSVGCTAYQQEQSQWCWAATCRMVDWTYSSVTPPAQCTIVNKANDQCDGLFATCCGNLDGSRPSACTTPSSSNQPNSMYGCNGSLSWLINYYAGGNTTYSSSLSYSTVSTNLYNNKMMVARWGWTSGGGHFVAIYGCYVLVTGSGSYNYVQYANPASGSKVTEDYSYFKSNSSRTWTHSIRMNGAAVRRDAMPQDELIEFSDGVRIYPNPSQGIISVERSDANTDTELQLANALGQVVYKTTLTSGESFLTLDLTGRLSPGMYYVSLRNDGTYNAEKLVIR